MVIVTALLQCIDHFIKKLFRLCPSDRGRYQDIEGPGMGGLAVVTNFMHNNIYYLTLKYSLGIKGAMQCSENLLTFSGL